MFSRLASFQDRLLFKITFVKLKRWASFRDSLLFKITKIANSSGGRLFEMVYFSRLLKLQTQAAGVFSRWSTFQDYLNCKLKRWASFQLNAVNIEIDDCKTMIKTTTQTFQSRNMLKYQTLLKKKANFIIYCHGLPFEMGCFLRLLFQTQEGVFFLRWDSTRD